MKKYLLIAALFVSHSTLAAQCRVDIKHELHLHQDYIEIHQANGEIAQLSTDHLQIAGQSVSLTEPQKAALNHYLQGADEYLAQTQQLADNGIELAENVIDDVASSLGAPNALNNLKSSVRGVWKDMQGHYYRDGDWVLPAATYEQMSADWKQYAEQAKRVLNKELASSAFNVMSEKMQAEGGLNLTELTNNVASLKGRVADQIAQHTGEFKQGRDRLCHALDDMVQREKALHAAIPELSSYQVFDAH